MAICPDDPHADLATHPATPQTVRRHRMLRPPLHEASLAFLSFCIFRSPCYRSTLLFCHCAHIAYLLYSICELASHLS